MAGFWAKIKAAFVGEPATTSAPAQVSTPKPAASSAAGTTCIATTAQGTACQSASREGSDYCGRHRRLDASYVAKPAAKKAAAKKPAAKKASAAKPAAKKADALNPQCAALTAAGGQCKNSARGTSKYCGSHKGYRPPAAKVAKKAEDTKPRTSGAKDTAPSGRRTQVSEGDYKLFQSGNRFFFSKKKQSEVKGDPVYKMPAGRTVTHTPNGLPVLKKN